MSAPQETEWIKRLQQLNERGAELLRSKSITAGHLLPAPPPQPRYRRFQTVAENIQHDVLIMTPEQERE